METKQCENCKEFIKIDDLTQWKGMTFCPLCRADLIRDKGEDLEDLVARAEYLEDR